MHRRSLLLYAPRRLAWQTEALPPLGSRAALAPAYPLMTGYESLAEVLACGDAVDRIAPGDRVVATYGHRTAAVLDESRAIPVPADISDQLVLLVILACDAAKGVAKLDLHIDDAVLIAGAGTVGRLTLFNLRPRDQSDIDVLEPLVARRALALAFGARTAFDPVANRPLDAAYCCGVECSSRDAAFAVLQAALARVGGACASRRTATSSRSRLHQPFTPRIWRPSAPAMGLTTSSLRRGSGHACVRGSRLSTACSSCTSTPRSFRSCSSASRRARSRRLRYLCATM